MSTKARRNASYLLPDTGGEVVRGLLDDIETLRAELTKAREEIEKLEQNKEQERQHRRTVTNNWEHQIGLTIKAEVTNNELIDFAIWMTGCGYDFCQHEYFCEKRDKLLIGKSNEDKKD